MSEEPTAIQPVPAESVAIIYHPREFHMYQIAEPELDSLGNATLYFSLDVGLFGISLGLCAAFAITLWTVEIESPFKFATFAALLGITTLASLFFGARTILSWRSMRSTVRQIKTR